MSLIKCTECGREISNQAEKCPHCGYPINHDLSKKKPIWLLIVAGICGIIAILVLISGASDFLKGSKNTNPLLNNYYLGVEKYTVYVIKFSDDNIVEVVDCGLGRDSDQTKKAYGSYEISESTVEITLSNGSSLLGIIHKNGDSITIGNENYTKTDPKTLSKKTIEAFD